LPIKNLQIDQLLRERAPAYTQKTRGGTMPKGFGVGLQVATIPIAGVQPLSPENGGSPPGGSPPGTSPGAGASSGGGLGGLGLIGLLLLVLGVGVPALVGDSDDQQAQVQPRVSQNGSELNRVHLGNFVAE
jgi:hypothetical protein